MTLKRDAVAFICDAIGVQISTSNGLYCSRDVKRDVLATGTEDM